MTTSNGWFSDLRAALALVRGGNRPSDAVADSLAHVSRTERTTLERAFPRTDYHRATRDGVQGNSAVLASIQGHLGAFPQPRMRVADRDGQFIENTPSGNRRGAGRNLSAQSSAQRLQHLLDKPNPFMSGSELLRIIALYQLVGGNAYLWKQRSKRDGSVLNLWPFHAAQMRPVPGATVDEWVSHYNYSADRATLVPIDATEIIHLKWPFLFDPLAPWEGLSPVIGLFKEIMTDNEATRLAWALMKNDAVGSSLWRIPSGLTEEKLEQVKGSIIQRFSGAAKGSPVVIQGKKDDVDVTRLSFDMQQMAADSLHAIPESRIAAGLRYPAIMSQLLTGLKEGREGNYESTRRLYHEDTLMPWWDQTSDDLDCGLTEAGADDTAAEFDGDLTIVFDTSEIVALKEKENDAVAREMQRSSSLKELQLLYYDGKLPRDAAIANAQLYTKMTDEDCDTAFPIVNPADKTPPPNDLRTTVGGMDSFMSLPAQVKSGDTTLEAARSLAVIGFGYTESEAAQLLPDSLAPKEPKAPKGGDDPPSPTPPTTKGNDGDDDPVIADE